MKILVCGDRNWINRKRIKDELLKVISERKEEFPGTIYSSFVVIHGGARGADTIAGEVAREIGMRVLVFPADWDKYGKAAGPIRNSEMLNEHPDIVLAFHKDLSKSKGTADTVSKSQKMKLKVKVISEEE